MKMRWAISAGLVLLTIFYIHLLTGGKAVPLSKPLAEFPLNIGPWRGQVITFPPELYDVLKADDSLSREYRDEKGQRVFLFVAYYAQQEEETLIHSPNNCLVGSGWQPVSREVINIPILEDPNQLNIKVSKIYLRKGIDEQLEMYWYQWQKNYITSDYHLKLLLIWSSIFKHQTNAAFVRFSSSIINGEVDKTFESQKGFIQQVIPILNTFFPTIKGSSRDLG